MTKVQPILVPTPSPGAGDAADSTIRAIAGFHIRLAHGAVYRHFTATFADLDLTQKQVSLLWLVDDHPDASQSDLAQRIQSDRATTMAIVNRLEARDYLRRGQSPCDGRKQTLNLTDRGRTALAAAKAALAAHERWLKSRFSDQEVETLIELLTRIHESTEPSLCSAPPGGSAIRVAVWG